jgi:hypothetical protein
MITEQPAKISGQYYCKLKYFETSSLIHLFGARSRINQANL